MATSRQEILVVCLVESSVTLLHEWGDVLVGYLSPLLQRMASGGTLKVRNDFRIGFVSYSDPHVHPNPILAKRFFSPPFQLTKELKDDPASLGLGRTASGRRRGMAILEGYVAVLEMFDAIAHTNPPPLPQTSNEGNPEPPASESICYLIHIASSPPNKARHPTWNLDPKLDSVTWESLPSHLLKRKIRTSMILTSPIPELQELYNNLSRTAEPFWLPIKKPNHKVFLSGLPSVSKDKIIPQKRASTDSLEPPPLPPPTRPPPQEQSSPPNQTPAPTIPSTNSTPPNPRTTTMVSTQTPTVPQPQPPSQPSPSGQPDQGRPNPGQNLDPVKLVSYLRNIEMECRAKFAAISQSRAAGKPKADLDAMQNELNQKLYTRQKLMVIYQQLIAKNRKSGGQESTLSGKKSQQMDFGLQSPQPNASASGNRQGSPGRATTNTSLAAFGPASIGNNPFQNLFLSTRPGMEVQMQKMLAERTRPPVLAAAPQSQPELSLSQSQMQPAEGTPNIAEVMTPRMNLESHVRRWHGILAWPSQTAAGRKENQIAIAFFTRDASLRCESWPQKLTLQPARVPISAATVQAWNKEFNPVIGLISHTPIIGNFDGTVQNIRTFRLLRNLIHTKNFLAYCKFDMLGGPPGTGVLVFPRNPQAQSDVFIAMVFSKTSLPAPLTAHLAVQGPPTDTVFTNDGSQNLSGAISALQTMPAEARAFLQQQQAVALAAYNQQQASQQQQAQQVVPNVTDGSTSPGLAFNITQFMQSIQTGGENSMGLTGLKAASSEVQPAKHLQPSAFNTNLQLLQFLNRQPDESQK